MEADMSTKRILTIVAVLLASSIPGAEDCRVSGAEDAAGETYLLRYGYTAGEQIRWRVVHLATTETTIQGYTQASKSRSASTKIWKVSEVDESGNVTFVYSVDNVDMWQQLPDRPELRYNSEIEQEVPAVYAHVPKTVGVPLATLKISTRFH